MRLFVHSLGYIAESTQEAVDDFFSGYARTMTEIGKERGWPKMMRASFDAQRGPQAGFEQISQPNTNVITKNRNGSLVD